MWLKVTFYATDTGQEPVRQWLHTLEKEEMKKIGKDIKTIQFFWPRGMPLVRKLDKNLWEIRTRLLNKISRIIFTIREDEMVLLHGFIKKTQKTLQEDLDLAKQRLKAI